MENKAGLLKTQLFPVTLFVKDRAGGELVVLKGVAPTGAPPAILALSSAVDERGPLVLLAPDKAPVGSSGVRCEQPPVDVALFIRRKRAGKRCGRTVRPASFCHTSPHGARETRSDPPAFFLKGPVRVTVRVREERRTARTRWLRGRAATGGGKKIVNCCRYGET